MIDVLAADDEAPALAELAHLLRADPRVGEIVTASSGADALRRLSVRPVDAAFLDAFAPKAVILSGGPASALDADAPRPPEGLFDRGLPVLGICYGQQVMVAALGGTVERTGLSEFGATPATILDSTSTLFNGQPVEQSVWMSHGDSVTVAPAGMTVTASTPGAPVAAFEDRIRRLYGVQWHPEVLHTAYGQRVLESFLWRGAGLAPEWTATNVVESLVQQVRKGRLDAALVALPLDASGLVLSPLPYQEPLIAALPASWPESSVAGLALKAFNHRPLFWFKRERNPAFFDFTRRMFERAGYTPAYVEEPAEHDVLLARIARGEGMILLPASFAAIQRQGVVFYPLDEASLHFPLALGVVTLPQNDALRAWLLPLLEESLA